MLVLNTECDLDDQYYLLYDTGLPMGTYKLQIIGNVYTHQYRTKSGLLVIELKLPLQFNTLKVIDTSETIPSINYDDYTFVEARFGSRIQAEQLTQNAEIGDWVIVKSICWNPLDNKRLLFDSLARPHSSQVIPLPKKPSFPCHVDPEASGETSSFNLV